MNSRFRPDFRIPFIALSAAAIYIVLYVALQLINPLAVHPATAAEAPAEIGNANCRVGVSVGTGDIATQISWIPYFKAGWFLNFATSSQSVPSNVDFVPMIGVFQLKDGSVRLPDYRTNIPLTDAGLGAKIANNPGATWIVGNEVDRIGQGDIEPNIYAIAYHDIYYFIKERDPSAKVAVSALVEVTPNRLQYLDMMWESYLDTFKETMPVDVWTMHLYILPEVDVNGQPNGIASTAVGTDPSLGRRESGGGSAPCPLDSVYCFAEHDDLGIFADQVVAMRSWMAEHEYQMAPLLITEYSILFPYIINPGSCFLQDEYGQCFTPERISNWVVGTFDYLNGATDPTIGKPDDNNRLVQQWLWYSLNTEVAGDSSDLLNEELTAPTAVGQVFRQETINIGLNANLFPVNPTHTTTTSNGDVTLTVRVRNNGSTTSDKPFEVTFYEDEELTQVIGTVTVPPTQGCVSETHTASIEWKNVPAGLHTYFVVVDSFQKIPESNEGDNVASGVVLVNPASEVFVPVSPR